MAVKFCDGQSVSWQAYLDSKVSDLKRLTEFKIFNNLSTNEERVNFCISRVIDAKHAKENKWVNKYFENVSSASHCTKCVVKSQQYREQGNTYFKRKQDKLALEQYTKSILYAPSGTEGPELSMGYANRSAVLYHMKKYKTCLGDIEQALENNCPKHLHHKLYYRKGQALHCLKRKEESEEAFEMCRMVADDTRKEMISKDIEDFKRKNPFKCCEPVTSACFPCPEVSYEKNNCLTQATSAVEMKHSEEQGRFLIANSNLKAGDTLIVEKPYAAVLLPDHYATHCHHCFCEVMAPRPCTQCVKVKYCSEKCRLESWEMYHHIECPYLDMLHSIGIAHLSLRIVLATGLHQLIKFRKESENRSLQSSVPGLDKDGLYGNTYLQVYHLMPHSEDMHVEDLFQYSMTAALLLRCLETSQYFCESKLMQSAHDCLEVSNDVDNQEIRSYIGGLLLRHILQLVCNAHAITELQTTQISDFSLVDTTSQVRIATAIYPTASLMNHSCDPLIIASFQNDILIVKAVKDVSAGEEIYNCYGPHHKRMSRTDRQLALQEQYFFTCTCKACIQDKEREDKLMALKCPKCSGPVDFPDSTNTPTSAQCCNCGHVFSVQELVQLVLQAQELFTEGVNLLEKQQLQAALDKFLKCHECWSTAMYKLHPHLAEVKDQIAKCYAMLGKFKKSAKYLSESVSITKDIYGETSIEYANELHKLAEILTNARQPKLALEKVEQAIKVLEIHYEKSHCTVQELLKLQDGLRSVVQDINH